MLPDVSLITVTEARSSLTLDNAATPAARAVTPPPGAPPAPSQSPPQSAPTLPAHVFGPSPAPTGSSDRTFVPMSVLQMGTHIKLCGVQCGVFNNDNSVVVSSSGRFRSVGERAVAFALSANVPYVSPGDSIQSADFVAVVSVNETLSGGEEGRGRRLGRPVDVDGTARNALDT